MTQADPPLELPGQLACSVPSSFAAHLAQFAAPRPSSLCRTSPRKRPLSPTSPVQSVPDRSRATPDRKPSLSRRRSTQTPPRADGTSPHFSLQTHRDSSTSAGEEDGTPLEAERKKKKKKRPSRPYADPSTYSELGDNPLVDYIQDDLDLLLCGINPGVRSAQLQQHYASPTNHFWKALAGSGLTDRLLDPSEGSTLPDVYGIGSTNLVPRPSAEMSELSNDEMRACVPSLLHKLVTYKPRMVAFVGMKICEVVFRYLHTTLSGTPSTPNSQSTPPQKKNNKKCSTSTMKRKPAMAKIQLGLQPVTISCRSDDDDDESLEPSHTIRFWCLPSTSARVVAYQLVDKIRIFGDLKQDVEALKADRLDVPSCVVDYRAEDVVALMRDQVKKEAEEGGGGGGAARTAGWRLTLIEKVGIAQDDGAVALGGQSLQLGDEQGQAPVEVRDGAEGEQSASKRVKLEDG